MKVFLSLILVLMMSCGNATPLSEQTKVVKEGIDTITDIEERFGEPTKFYKEFDKTNAIFVAKYENILESDVVYLRFIYINDTNNLKAKRGQKDKFISVPNPLDKFKQDWVLYEVDRRPNKHS